jgi:hypothetical protein
MATFKFQSAHYDKDQFAPVVDSAGKIIGVASNATFGFGRKPVAIHYRTGAIYKRHGGVDRSNAGLGYKDRYKSLAFLAAMARRKRRSA